MPEPTLWAPVSVKAPAGPTSRVWSVLVNDAMAAAAAVSFTLSIDPARLAIARVGPLIVPVRCSVPPLAVIVSAVEIDIPTVP